MVSWITNSSLLIWLRQKEQAMLKHLQKFFGDNPQAALVALDAQASIHQEEDVSMTDVTQASGASADVDAALKETVASLTAQLATANEKIATLTAQVEAAVEFKAAQEKAAAEARTALRKAKLEDVVGTEAAVGLLAATALMDDTAFEAVVAAVAFKATKEAATPAFKEVGVEGSADATKLAAEAQGSKVMDYLKVIANETTQAN
jgi:hypothetical protein